MMKSYFTRVSHQLLKTTTNFSTVSNVEKEIIIYSNKKQTPVSLKSLMDTGRGDRLSDFSASTNTTSQSTASQRVLTQVACFLHRELPIRLAHRATRLESSPIFASNGVFVIFTGSVVCHDHYNVQNTSNTWQVGTKHLLHNFERVPLPVILNVRPTSRR